MQWQKRRNVMHKEARAAKNRIEEKTKVHNPVTRPVQAGCAADPRKTGKKRKSPPEVVSKGIGATGGAGDVDVSPRVDPGFDDTRNDRTDL